MANDILLFADDTGANVLTQVAYAADTQRTLGNQPGIARANFVNKVLRQTSFMSVALAQLIVDKTGNSVLDDGDDATLLANIKKAVNGFIGSNIASATTTTIGAESSGDIIHVTGTTTITSLGISITGTKRTVIFDGILTLTYNATSLILPSAGNIATSAGSVGQFVCIDGALGYWKCIGYIDDVVNKAQLKTYFDTLYSAVGSGSVSGIRQTVQSSAVDASGYANFISIGTGLAVNIAATTTPIKIHAAGGAISNDRLGTISADTSITGLTANTTNYLYADIAAGGAVTLTANTVNHIEQFGGTPAITNNLLTFNIGEMNGYLGNSTTAPQAWRVPIGEAVTNATNVTSVVNYALNGIYDSGYIATLPNVAVLVSKNHNIGVYPLYKKVLIKCTTIDLAYAVGDEIEPYTISGGANVVLTPSVNTKVMSITTGSSNAFAAIIKNTGGSGALTAASWSYKLIAHRGW